MMSPCALGVCSALGAEASLEAALGAEGRVAVVGTGEGAQGTTQSVLLSIGTEIWGGLQVAGGEGGV